jgi:low affinity Fe/Cu permease
MQDLFEGLAQRVAWWAGQPPTFSLALGVVIVWALTGPLFAWSDTWQLVINTGTTIVTFLMVFLIQSAQNRDASAIQAKLDELIRALDPARDEFIGIEHLSERDIAAVLKAIEDEYGAGTPRHEAISRLVYRR